MMKKILLTSTALVLATSVASADAPMVKVGGTVDARIASVDQKDLYKNISDDGTSLTGRDTHHTESTKMSTEASVTVEAMGKADNGIEYGSEIKFDIDTSVGATSYKDAEENDVTNTYHDGKSVRLHHANVYVKSGMGHVALGGTKSAAHSLKVVAPSIATGGAVDGDWTDYVNMEVGRVIHEGVDPTKLIAVTVADPNNPVEAFTAADYEAARYLTGDVLPGDASTASKYSNKIAFYTPKMSGFQAGISYGLDTNNYGGHTGFASKYSNDATHPAGVRNNVSVAATYEHQMNDMLAQFSVAGEFGDTKNTQGATVKFRDVKAFEVGASVCADEFKLGGTYGSLGKSLNLKDVAATAVDVGTEINERNNSKGYFWTLGATYVNGPVSLGANYYASKLQGNKVRTFGLAAEYALAEGLTTYVEANFFKLTPKASGVYQLAAAVGNGDSLHADTALATKNDGSVFLLGTKVNF